MAPGARNKFGAFIFEPELFRKEIYCIEESTRDLLGLFGAPVVISPPGNRSPLPPFVLPLHA